MFCLPGINLVDISTTCFFATPWSVLSGTGIEIITPYFLTFLDLSYHCGTVRKQDNCLANNPHLACCKDHWCQHILSLQYWMNHSMEAILPNNCCPSFAEVREVPYRIYSCNVQHLKTKFFILKTRGRSLHERCF